MEQLSLWNDTAWWVQLVYNLLLLVIPTLVGLVIATESGRVLISRIRALYKTVRPAFDEPRDPLVVLIAAKIGRKPEEVTAFLTDNLDAVIALLPPEQKANLTEAVK